MSGLWTIAKKDFKGYLGSPGFYIIGGLFTLFLGVIYIYMINYFMQKATMSVMMGGGKEGLNMHREIFMGLIYNINLVLLFLIPFLTVRLIAEERKMRTFDLVLTSPVTATDIAIGKFLAALMAVGVLLLIFMIYPAALGFFTKLHWPTLLSAFLGMLLMASVYIAIGVFASSLTESVILSGFIAIMLSLSLWFVNILSVGNENATLTAVVNHISVSQHFMNLLQGSLQTSSLVFFSSVIALYCFLAQRVVESARWR